jgi:uncharacterized membrane protein YidH (DUF202 family)
VQEGAVRCENCGAQLERPGAFLQVVGWVTLAVAAIPFGIAEVATDEKDYLPLEIAAGIVISGIAMVLAGKLRARASPPTVIK